MTAQHSSVASRILTSLAAILLLSVVVVGSACTTASTSTDTKTAPKPVNTAGAVAATMQNLQTAYDGETNAIARYGAFAAKADRDGYHQVAALFRAAARAESVHAENYARVLKDLGASPTSDIQQTPALATVTNVKTAISAETWECETLYPQFVARAKKAHLENAAQAMNFSLKAEQAHQALFNDALAHMNAWRSVTKTFYVCPVCGNTVTALDFATCPVCASPKEAFKPIK